MNFLFPFVGAILNSLASALDKSALFLRGVNSKSFLGTGYPLSFLGAIVLFFIVRPPLSLNLFGGISWLLILLWVAISVGLNFLFYQALQRDELGEIQVAGLFKDLLIILVSSIVFADERNLLVIVFALVASISVIWSHWENRRFNVKKHTLLLVAYSLISAPIIATISKILLRTWDPVSLQMVRWGILSIIFISLFYKAVKKIQKSAYPLLILTNFISVVGWALYYYSYQISGIIYTVLLFSLQPFLVYLMSIFFLKETFQPKKAFAFGIVLISIASVQLFG